MRFILCLGTNIPVSIASGSFFKSTWFQVWWTNNLIETHQWYFLSRDIPIRWNEINTFSNGCLGSHNDEERSEMRYVMRIAKTSESSKFWTHLALPSGEYVCWSVCSSLRCYCLLIQRVVFASVLWLMLQVPRWNTLVEFVSFLKRCSTRRPSFSELVSRWVLFYPKRMRSDICTIRSDLQSGKNTRWI